MKSSIRQSPQELQDQIFRRMSADRKLEVGAMLWRLAKDLVGDKISYGNKRSTASFVKIVKILEKLYAYKNY